MFLFFFGLILGYIIWYIDKLPDLAENRDILHIQPPKDQRKLQRLLGLSQFKRMFIKDLDRILAPISALNKLYYEVEKNWDAQAKSKKLHANHPVLNHLNVLYL
jgi:hypothetical protein